jgi:hypothetical protein
MSLYVHKPVLVDAVQLRPDNWDSEMVPFLGTTHYKLDQENEGFRLYLHLEYAMKVANENDWIVKDAYGELFCYSPTLFDENYLVSI